MREKKKKIKKLTWSLINAPLCVHVCIFKVGREKNNKEKKKKLIGVQ
jgi:hypothetical protein